MMMPVVKPYEGTVQTAANLFGITYSEADEEMIKRLSHLELSELDIVVYVNWASHNALTYNELASHLDIPVKDIKWRLEKLRRVFPHLFSGGPIQTVHSD
jgi:membrane-anchored protein YejM (alkaline phosphatase superfamily)